MRGWRTLVLSLALAAPLSAQTVDADRADQSTQPRRPAASRPAPRRTPIVFRAFGEIAEQAFTAKTTFDGIFGNSAGTFFGGGGQVVLPDGVFGEVSVSHLSRTGERAFRSDGQTFQLGIPLTATITPIEFAGGYRFRLRKHRTIVPYAGAGIGSYGYKETSDFADPKENASARHVGYLAAGGVEVRVQRWMALDFGAQFTHIPGILGAAGFSKDAGDDDLGGGAFHFKVVVGK